MPILVLGLVATALVGSADAAGLIGTSKLRNGAITTAKLKNGAVTTAKLHDGAVTAAKLAPGTVVAGKGRSSRSRDGSPTRRST